MVITKLDILEYLFEKFNLTKKEAKELIECFLKEIKNSLEIGEIVKFSGFGNFYLLYKKQRPGRNPQNGKIIPISARRVVVFKPGQKLRSRVEKFKNL